MGDMVCEVGGGEGCIGKVQAYRSTDPARGIVEVCLGHRDGQVLLHNGFHVTIEYYDAVYEPTLACEYPAEGGQRCGATPAVEYYCSGEAVRTYCGHCCRKPDAEVILGIREYYGMLLSV